MPCVVAALRSTWLVMYCLEMYLLVLDSLVLYCLVVYLIVLCCLVLYCIVLY